MRRAPMCNRISAHTLGAVQPRAPSRNARRDMTVRLLVVFSLVCSLVTLATFDWVSKFWKQGHSKTSRGTPQRGEKIKATRSAPRNAGETLVCPMPYACARFKQHRHLQHLTQRALSSQVGTYKPLAHRRNHQWVYTDLPPAVAVGRACGITF